jgi:hypothetical protein
MVSGTAGSLRTDRARSATGTPTARTEWPESRRNSGFIGQIRSNLRAMQPRVLHLAIFWAVVWPIISICAGAIDLTKYPSTKEVPYWIAFPGVAFGTMYLIAEFFVSAVILILLSSLFFISFPLGSPIGRRRYFLEPAIAYVGLSLGVALEFPSVLNNALFMPLRHANLLSGYIALLLVLLVFALFRHGLHPQNRQLARSLLPCIGFVLSGWLLTQCPMPGSHRMVNQGSTVILGIDSLGVEMAEPLRKLSDQSGGCFYERAVTPGLLTNAVWTAIVSHRPSHDTGTLLTFQSPDWNRSPYQMIREARNRGFQTWSFFTGQNTIYTGSLAGFDHDRSGPMGWLQNATSAAKNGSILVPLIISRLPLNNLFKISSNQAGTYPYDLRVMVRSILGSRSGPKPVFAVAHLGYLHDEAYPRFAELPKGYRSLLLRAPIDSLQDLGADWQLPATTGDVISLHRWKVQNVQEVVASELRNSGFLDPRNGNRLVLLSDHGMRTDLTNDNFGREDYYRVPLITFGLPAHNISAPISLLDIPNLIGLEDPTFTGSAVPAVEYVNISAMEEFKAAVLGGSWFLDGRINFKTDIGQKYLSLLKSYNPSDHPAKPLPVIRIGNDFAGRVPDMHLDSTERQHAPR